MSFCVCITRFMRSSVWIAWHRYVKPSHACLPASLDIHPDAAAAATSTMVVFVQRLGQVAPLRIEMPSQGATVGLLKALISLAIHQPSHHMQLVFNGQQLASDAQPIADTGITRESSVTLRIITPNDDTPAPQRAIDGTLTDPSHNIDWL